MLPLAGYTRVSRVGDREETLISPELQQDRIRQYAESRGLAVEYLPPELDVSGGKRERPLLDRVIAGVEHGRYAGIVVADIDRLSRMDLAGALHVIDRIEKAGGQVIAVAQNFDVATPEGEWARNVWLSTAHMMLRRYSAQFRSAKLSAVERGVWPVPTVPIGYTVTRRKHGGDGKLTPDPATRHKVVEAFEARASGKPWRSVGAILDVGITGAGKIIRNRAYLGELHLGEWVNLEAHEPIVGLALWEAAQIKHPRPARSGGPGALLAGIVRCAGCQSALTPNASQKGRYRERIYRCVNNKAAGKCLSPAIISQAKLDTAVEEAVLLEIDRLAITARQKTTDLERAQTALLDAQEELAAYHEATKVTDVGADAFTRGARARQRTVEEAADRLARLWEAASPAVDSPATLREAWPDLTVEERRHVLRRSLGAVWVSKGRGPVTNRVRLVARGFETGPARLRGRVQLEPLDWVADLPGEIPLAATQDFA